MFVRILLSVASFSIIFPAVVFIGIIVFPGLILKTLRIFCVKNAENKAQQWIAKFYINYGRIWHGYEISGLQSVLSLEKPVLFIFFHGAIGIDLAFFVFNLISKHKKTIYGVSDVFLHKLPFYKDSSKVQNCIKGSKEECLRYLKSGHSLVIAPGGSYEAMFGDNFYNIMWRNRVGFAKLAKEAEVEIVPVFTENIQEAFRPISIFQKLLLKFYLKTRIPLMPMFGGIPVKLISHVGNPIKITNEQSPEDIRKNVEESLKNLIKQNQRIPGSFIRALFERI